MNPVLRLYPKAWRERYGDELEQLLADDPPGFLGMIDLVRGALDARLHASLVPATAGGGASPVSGDVPAARARFPLAPFMGTLAAGLFFVTSAAMFLQFTLPTRASWQLPSYLLILASVSLGVTVLLTTGRSVIARLAGLAFLSAVIFFWWDAAYVPASYSVMAGGILLALGSLVERQPSRSVGGLAAGMTLAWWISHAAMEHLPLVAAGFGVVALGLVVAERAWIRPVLTGAVMTAAVAAAMTGVVLANEPPTLYPRYAVHCGTTDEQACLAQLEELEARFRTIRPIDTIVQGEVLGNGGVIRICAIVSTADGGPNPFDDPIWVSEHGTDLGAGLRLTSTSTMGGDSVRQSCWEAE